jgi:tetratricopeptide (TPR) repeat protein
MKKIYILLVLLCFQNVLANSQNIYKEPIFYRTQKTIKQADAEREFVEKIENSKISKEEAVDFYITRGWYFYHRNSLDTAMLKFNQAYLLDTENPDVYWGMGCIMGKREQTNNAIDLFKKGLQKDKDHTMLMMHLSSAYVEKTFLPYVSKSNKDRLLFTANRLIVQVIDKDRDNGDAHYRRAIIAFLRKEYAQAWRSLETTKQLTPHIIQHDFVYELARKNQDSAGMLQFEFLNEF